MARASDDLQEKAKSLYQQGKSLKDIAEELGLSQGTVRSWKSRHKWEADNPTKQRNATQHKKRNVASKKDTVSPAVRSVMENDALTDQQKEFCLIFSRSFNATQSYIKAFGAKYNTAMTESSKLLRIPKIRDEVNRLKEERYTRSFVSVEDIFQKYLDIAFSDLGDYVWFGREMVPVMGPYGPLIEKLPDGTERPLMREVNTVRFREATEVNTSVIAELKQGKDGASIKLQDRLRALDWLTEHMSMATDRQKLELQKLQAEIAKVSGDDGTTVEDDGFLEALSGKVEEVWQEE